MTQSRVRLAAALALCCVLGLPIAPGAARAEVIGEVEGVTVERHAGASRIETAVAVSEAAFETATAVVLARADDFADALVGAPLAAELRGPILLSPPDGLPAAVAAEIERLEPDRIVLLGGTAALSEAVEQAARERRPTARVAGADRYATAAAVAETMTVTTGNAVLATGEDFPDALAAASLAAATGVPVLLTRRDTLPAPTAAALEVIGATDVIVAGGTAAVGEPVVTALTDGGRTARRVAGPDRYTTAALLYDEARAAGLGSTELWLATGRGFPDALAAGPAVAARGAAMLLVDGEHLRRADAPAARVRAAKAALDRLVLVGGQAAVAGGLEEVAALFQPAPELPGGGRSIFPERRVVAFYGSSASPALGVLGEGSPQEAADRLLGQAGPYATPERPLLAAFEFIGTIALSSPGPEGDYSGQVDPAQAQVYLDAARAIGAVFIIDIQPGRTDFLTEAQRWEAFLTQPDVGLALDPEWRMGPDERPGQTIGSVDAAEVNAVSAWLAEIVDRHDLPDKLFVLHQFRHDMITNRDQVAARPGLETVIHMDGFGSRGQKLETYAQLVASPPLFNGFKLFYDEDTDIFQPHEVLVLDPPPDLVTYQ